ncbi:MAG: AAA family ATPase [Oscillospiraceae bacterium]|nr:AAA family ATPase [Oscillospiraceae bacterium]
MKIDLSFDPAWFYSSERNIFSIGKVIRYFEENCGDDVHVLERTQMSCSLEVERENGGGELIRQFNEFLKETICADVKPGTEPYQITVDGEIKRNEAAAFPPDVRKPGAEGAPAAAMTAIEDLVGADAFKALCRELQAEAPGLLADGTAPLFRRTAYLFAAAQGAGGEEVVPLFDRLLHETGLLEGASDPFRLTMEPDKDGNLVLSGGTVEGAYSNARLVLISIGAALDRTQEREFKSVLLEIFRRNRDCVTVFQMPYASQTLRERVLEDLSDILSVEAVVFPPLNEVELRQIAERELAAYAYEAEEEVWPLYQAKLEQEGRDGCFYGADTVRKVTGEMILAARRTRTQEQPEKVVTAKAMGSLLRQRRGDAESGGLNELDAMVGMEPVAAQIREMIRSVQFARSDPQGEIPAMHMVFTGNPGTGKTTVARIVGKALRDAGVLRIGNFVECAARDLVGRYVGHTAPKTRQMCERAYGSVLFIDEAYALASSDSDVDYGKEALAALIAEMENHRDDLVVIFAGYTQEMNRFLDVNPGLRSRIPYHIQFPNYTKEELFEIFRGMIGTRFAYDPAILSVAENYIRSLPDELLEERTFGNGRFIRNLYEKLWSKAAMRSPGVRPDELRLELEDFDEVVRESAASMETTSKKLPRVGF